MGIQINSGAATLPAITFDRVHVTDLMIRQPIFTDDTAIPKYTVEVHYRTYGLANDVRYYSDGPVQVVVIEDFIAAGMANAANNDMTLLNALSSIESAVAAILSDQGLSAQQV